MRTFVAGSPQGGMISPLLASVYPNVLDSTWEARFGHLGRVVRYADDLVVLGRRRTRAQEALDRVREILDSLGLTPHPERTRLCELGLGQDGLVFLRCYLRVVKSHFEGKTYLFRWPSPKAMKAVRSRIRELTDRRRRAGTKDIREVIRELNPVLRGWGNDLRTGNASRRFSQVDRHVWRRLETPCASPGPAGRPTEEPVWREALQPGGVAPRAIRRATWPLQAARDRPLPRRRACCVRGRSVSGVRKTARTV